MTYIHLHIDEVPNLCNAKFDDLSECTINAFSPSMILPVRIFFIGFASLGITEEHLCLYKSETQTGLLWDVDLIISFQARFHRGRANMPSKLLFEVLLQVSEKLELAIQVQTSFQFHSSSSFFRTIKWGQIFPQLFGRFVTYVILWISYTVCTRVSMMILCSFVSFL